MGGIAQGPADMFVVYVQSGTITRCPHCARSRLAVSTNLSVTRHGYHTRATRAPWRLYPHPWVCGYGYVAGTGAGRVDGTRGSTRAIP